MTDPTSNNEFSPPAGPPVAPTTPFDTDDDRGRGAAAVARSTTAHDAGSEVAVERPTDADHGAHNSPSDASPSRRGWWHRNRSALIAIVILVPVTGAVIFGKGIRTSRSARPTDPITVEAGQTAVYSGATVGPTVATFTDDRSGAPHSRVLRVTTSIANGGELYCNDLTLRELTRAEREWQTASESFATDESAVLYCDPTQAGPYDLQSFFVVPADATGPFAVELYVPELLPQYVQFIVDPAAGG